MRARTGSSRLRIPLMTACSLRGLSGACGASEDRFGSRTDESIGFRASAVLAAVCLMFMFVCHEEKYVLSCSVSYVSSFVRESKCATQFDADHTL